MVYILDKATFTSMIVNTNVAVNITEFNKTEN